MRPDKWREQGPAPKLCRCLALSARVLLPGSRRSAGLCRCLRGHGEVFSLARGGAARARFVYLAAGPVRLGARAVDWSGCCPDNRCVGVLLWVWGRFRSLAGLPLDLLTLVLLYQWVRTLRELIPSEGMRDVQTLGVVLKGLTLDNRRGVD